MRKLNLACAEDFKEGIEWINIDLHPVISGTWKMDALYLPFKNETIDEIMVSHFLEHLTYVEINPALTEWRRVLKYWGKLEIIVPDISVISHRWNDLNLQGKFFYMCAIMGSQRGPGQEHKNVVDKDILEYWLQVNGFFVKKLYNSPEHDFWLICEAIKVQ